MSYLFKTTQSYKYTGLTFLALLFFAWAVTSSAGVPVAIKTDKTIANRIIKNVLLLLMTYPPFK